MSRSPKNPRGSRARGSRDILREAIVCFHVAHDLRPIRLVWRDREDGAWGIACGRAHHEVDRIGEWGMARLFSFTADDPEMRVVHELRRGQSAERDGIGSPWRLR